MQTDNVTSTKLVLEAVTEFARLNQPATRHTIARHTGLPLGKVDDRIKALCSRELIRRGEKSKYVPIETYPAPRPISKTLVPGVGVKIEVGDEMLQLTPDEDRKLAEMGMGTASQAVHIQMCQLMTESVASSTLIAKRVDRAAVTQAELADALVDLCSMLGQLNERLINMEVAAKTKAAPRGGSSAKPVAKPAAK